MFCAHVFAACKSVTAHIVLLFLFLLCQSVDSSSDVLCLKERIHRAQEERDKREERMLHAQTLQQAGKQRKPLSFHLRVIHWHVKKINNWCWEMWINLLLRY